MKVFDAESAKSMNGLRRIKNTIDGKPVDYPGSIFIATTVACKILNVPMSQWSTRPEVLADTLMRFTEICGCDGVYITRDNLVVHQAMGGQVVFPDDGDAVGSAPVLASLKDFDKLAIPDPFNAAGMGTVLQAAALAKNAAAGRFYVMANIDCGPFSTAANLRGVQNFLYDIMTEDPALVHEYLEFCTQLVVAYGKAMQQTGVDGIQYGDSTASMLSPKLFSEFALPYQKKSIELLKKDNCDFWLHICGQCSHLLEMLKGLPIQVFEADAMVSLADVNKKWNNCIVKGNLDTIKLQNNTPDRVYQETVEMIKSCNYNRLIVSAGCGVPQMTPLENIQAMTHACRDVKFL